MGEILSLRKQETGQYPIPEGRYDPLGVDISRVLNRESISFPDTNVLITSLDSPSIKKKIEESNSLFPPSVEDEFRGYIRTIEVSDNRNVKEFLKFMESNVSGEARGSLEERKEAFKSALYRDLSDFDRNMRETAPYLPGDKDDVTEEHNEVIKVYLSNLVTMAIAKNRDDLTESKQNALDNIVTDAELVFLGLYSAVKGKRTEIISDDSDVPKILNYVFNEATQRTEKLMKMEEEDIINKELDVLYDVEKAKLRFSNCGSYAAGCCYGNSLRNTAAKIMKESQSLKESRSL